MNAEQLAPLYIGLSALIVAPLTVGLRFLLMSATSREEWRTALKQHRYLPRQRFNRYVQVTGAGLLCVSAAATAGVIYLYMLGRPS